jgi:hypothetical protein
MQVTRRILVASIVVALGHLGVLPAIHGPVGLHAPITAPDFGALACEAGHHDQPADFPTDSSDHRDCSICHLIAQGAAATLDSASPRVDRVALPPQQLWLVHVIAISQVVHSPIGARAPPLA